MSNVTCVVPQRRILGPLVFTIYASVNVVNSSCYLYADVTTIAVSGNTPHEIQMKLNQSPELLAEWLNSNALSLNIDKS